MMKTVLKYGNVLFCALLAVVIYFIYIHNFFGLSLGLHPDNVNNINLHVMLSKGISPNSCPFVTTGAYGEREMFNFIPVGYIFFSLMFVFFSNPVVALAVTNYLLILAFFILLFFITKKFFYLRTAVLTLINTILSVWLILIFRMNFSAYIAVCLLSLLIIFFYWKAITARSYGSLAVLCALGLFAFFTTTWPIAVLFFSLFLYSLFDAKARDFIFLSKAPLVILVVSGVVILLFALISMAGGAKGNFIEGYYNYFWGQRFLEHVAGAGNLSWLDRRRLAYVMLFNYYGELRLLWGHAWADLHPVRLINPLILVIAVLSLAAHIFKKGSFEKFLSFVCLVNFVVLTAFFIPNERYYVAIVPIFYLMASLLVVRLIDRIPAPWGLRIFVLVCACSLGLGVYEIQHNYLPYNKVINSYILGDADRRRHGIEDVRAYLAKRLPQYGHIYLGFNVSTERMDLINYFGVNYSPKMSYLESEAFAERLMKSLAQGSRQDELFVYVLSEGYVNTPVVKQFFKDNNVGVCEKLFDVTGFNYMNIYCHGSSQ